MNFRLPGVDTAIKYLHPDAKWDLCNQTFTRWDCPHGSKPPTCEEIQERVLKDTEIYNYYRYIIDRERLYGDWRDQLNLLFDDIKSGNLENGKWVQMVESVKKQYPKPEGNPPV